MLMNQLTSRQGRDAFEENKEDGKKEDGKKEIGDVHTDNSSVGSAFVQHFVSHDENPYDEKNIPKVECKFKINKVSSLDQVAQTFTVEFTLMLDWVDPSLDRQNKPKTHVPDWDEHFSPGLMLLNAQSIDTDESQPRLRPPADLHDGSREYNHVTMTQKFAATIDSRMDLRNYPFDIQYLEIIMKLRSISNGNKWILDLPEGPKGKRPMDKSVFPQFRNPVTWRYETGHQIAENADWLGEFDFVGDGESTQAGQCMFGKPTSEHRVGKK